MDSLERKKKEAEKMRMRSNIMEKEVLIEERKLEIIRIGKTIKSYQERIKQLDTILKEGEES